MKLNFLYWNIKKKPCSDLIAALAQEHGADIIGISECEISPEDLLSSLNNGGGGLYFSSKSMVSDSILVTRLLPDSVKPAGDDPHFSIWQLNLSKGEGLLLVMTHFFSKLFRGREDYLFKCYDLASTIKDLEEKYGIFNTVIMGDLNMNPFEEGLAAAAGLNAVMDKRVAAQRTRIVDRKEYRFFYNPMWSHLGDFPSGPSGSYYYNSGKQVNYYWNIFDQVLIRPELIKNFIDRELRVLTEAGGKSLLTPSGVPDNKNASDHLPIRFRLEMTKGDEHERELKPMG